MQPGSLLDGRYRMLDKLGEGGMADVYLMEDLFLHRKVAIKLLRLDFRDNPKNKKRFHNEAVAITELDNPHIVGIYDIGETEGLQYIVMEYIQGQTLKSFIKNHFPIAYDQVVDIMCQVTEAVNEAHTHGIIHQDLKPQNILVSDDLQVKIADFGISKIQSENTMTQTNSIIGSIHYLSPEQVKGQPGSRQSDIYSLGIILYELLTGKVPFDGGTAVAIALKHSQNAMPLVRDFDQQIPQALENVILKATAKNPADRYDSVSAMQADLNSVLSPTRANEERISDYQEENDATKVMPFMPLKDDNLDVKQPSNHQEKQVSKKANRPWWAKKRVLLSGLLLIVMMVVAMFLLPQSARVPQVRGDTKTVAVNKLKQAGFAVGRISYRFNNRYDAGRVISSNPKSSQKVTTNTKIKLVVSKGIKKMTIENYVGKDYNQVASQLRKQGITVKKRTTPSYALKSGQIVQQDIKDGKRVIPKKTTITFVTAIEMKPVVVADLVGMTKAEVVDYAQKHNLNPVLSYQNNDQQPKGRVVSQSPLSGSKTYRGNDLNVVISRGPVHKNPAALDSFDVMLTIPYVAPDTDLESDDDDEDDEASENTIDEAKENIILIYIQDYDHKLKNIYKQIVITKDEEIKMPFKLKSGTVGRYKIVRNGKVILRDNNVTADTK